MESLAVEVHFLLEALKMFLLTITPITAKSTGSYLTDDKDDQSHSKLTTEL
jgi:hypothetical protein